MDSKRDVHTAPSGTPSSIAHSTGRGSMHPFTQALLAGGVAGTTVDLSLYPIDTLKTRLQSAGGFRASGGFRGIYAGVGSAAIGAAPGAAFFFVSYEAAKAQLRALRESRYAPEQAHLVPLEHMAAASVGEIAACAVRVPTEVVKQRAQAREYGSSAEALRAILARRAHVGVGGVVRELYRGWGITVMREVPFTVVQFPLWEAMKSRWAARKGTDKVGALESAVFGSVSGAIAAAVTTPLDVLKTRMMLSTEKTTLAEIFAHVMRTTGPRGFLAGIGPRIAWISAGGAVFLGSYQWAYNALGA